MMAPSSSFSFKETRKTLLLHEPMITKDFDRFVKHEHIFFYSLFQRLIMYSQARVYEELDDIFKGTDRECTFQDTLEMKYLERVIMETLRLFPPVPAIARHLNEDVRLGKLMITVDKIFFRAKIKKKKLQFNILLFFQKLQAITSFPKIARSSYHRSKFIDFRNIIQIRKSSILTISWRRKRRTGITTRSFHSAQDHGMRNDNKIIHRIKIQS